MKKTFKIKAMVFSMIALMAVVLVPSVNAAKFENSVAESEAGSVFSLNADKTTVNPGDTVTVTLKLETAPKNGINSLGGRIVFDSSKLTLNKTMVDVEEIKLDENGDEMYDEEGEPIYETVKREFDDIEPGRIGKGLDISYGNAVITNEGDSDTLKCIGFAGAKDATQAVRGTGDVVIMKFTVNQNVSGNIEMYLKSTSIEDDGFSATTVKTEDGNKVTDDSLTFYIKSNLDQLTIKVPAKGVSFTGISGLTLDTAGNNNSGNLLLDHLVIDPENTTDTVVWDTEDHDVATVANGIVTAVGKGTTNVVVTVGEHTAKLPVTVTIPLTGIEFTGLTSVNLDVTTNKTQNIYGNVNLLPDGAEAAGYEWSSDNTAVATVENGLVTAVGKGTANITVKVGTFTATVPVNVTVSVGSVSINTEKVVLDTKVNKTTTLVANVGPEGAVANSIVWSTSNDKVATVEQNGVVTAVGEGKATITVTADGKTASVPVSVTVPLETITLEKDTVTVYKNDTVKVGVTAGPEGAEWETLDASIKSGKDFAMTEVKENNVEITGLATGTTVVTVAANGGSEPALVKEITVTVKENPITSLKITAEDDKEILRDATKALTATYTTKEAESIHKATDNTKVVWSSSNEKVATVDQNGVVTAVREGKVTITAKIADGKITATYEVTVKENHIKGIIPDEEAVKAIEELEKITVGDVIEIPFVVDPEDCTDTAEEILEYIKSDFDSELVDVTVTYDEETGKGMITIVTKKAGDAEIVIEADDPATEDEVEYFLITLAVQDPVVEEAPETGDAPIAMVTMVMAISLAGIAVSKKVLVK